MDGGSREQPRKRGSPDDPWGEERAGTDRKKEPGGPEESCEEVVRRGRSEEVEVGPGSDRERESHSTSNPRGVRTFHLSWEGTRVEGDSEGVLVRGREDRRTELVQRPFSQDLKVRCGSGG